MANNFNFTRSGYTPTEPYNFNFGVVLGVYEILKGLSNNFVAIWASADAGLSAGKMYIASGDTFNVIDLENQEIYDYYTQTHGGRANETLDSDDIVDINVA
jgi:hypothetical protein